MLYSCKGYWKEDGKKFEDTRVSSGEWDGNADAADESIFYYTAGEAVVGDHGEFVITEAIPENGSQASDHRPS